MFCAFHSMCSKCPMPAIYLPYMLCIRFMSCVSSICSVLRAPCVVELERAILVPLCLVLFTSPCDSLHSLRLVLLCLMFVTQQFHLARVCLPVLFLCSSLVSFHLVMFHDLFGCFWVSSRRPFPLYPSS